MIFCMYIRREGTWRHIAMGQERRLTFQNGGHFVYSHVLDSNMTFQKENYPFWSGKLKGWMHNRLMSNFRPFFNFSQICQKFCMWTAIRLKNVVQFFFWPICVSYSRNNVCKELCFSLRTQRNRQLMLSLRVLIIRSVTVICKLHYVFLAQV